MASIELLWNCVSLYSDSLIISSKILLICSFLLRSKWIFFIALTKFLKDMHIAILKYTQFSNHLEISQCLYNNIFLLRWAFRLSGIFRFRQIVIFPLNNTTCMTGSIRFRSAKNDDGTYSVWTGWNELNQSLNHGHYDLKSVEECEKIFEEFFYKV